MAKYCSVKKNASGKSWMISVDKEYYSQSRGSALKSKGFTDAGGGGGSYEFDISGKSRSEVKDIVNQVFGSDSGSISIIDIGQFNSAKKNEDFADVHNFMRLAPAELIKKFEELENENYHSQARKIIVDWTTQHRAERAAKKNSVPRKFCSKKSA